MKEIPNHNLESYLHDALSNAAVPPPPNIWARIDDALPAADELALLATLGEAEVTAPEGAWGRITAIMDNNTTNTLADTDDIDTIFAPLATHEVRLTTDIWSKIEAVLPIQHIEDIDFTALSIHTVAPAADMWSKIGGALDSSTDTDLPLFTALADAEIAPQRDFWSEIASILDEEAELQVFSALSDYELAPAADMWSRIAAKEAADDSALMQFAALANHTVEPAERTWGQIAARLEQDDDGVATLIGRLRHTEPAPAPRVWSRISQELPLNPGLRRHLTNFSRIAAVLLATFTASVFYNNWYKIDNEPIAAVHEATVKNSESIGQNNQNSENNIAAIQKNTRSNTASNTITSPQNTPSTIVETSGGISTQLAENVHNPVRNFKNSEVMHNSSGKIDDLMAAASYAKQNTNGEPINKNIITPLQSLDANALPIADAKNEILVEILPPSRYLTPEMQQFVINKMREGVPGFNANNLDFQFVETIDNLGNAKTTINPYDNINSLKNDNPVENLIDKKGWSLGANVQMLSPTIFNSRILQTLTPLGGEVTQAISFRLGYGVALGYQWSKHNSLSLEYNYTQQGQTYLRAAAGKNEALNLSANYHHIAALYARQIALPTNNFALNLVAGAQYGLLNAPSFSMQGDTRISASDIAQYDLGAVGGIDAQYFLNTQTILSLGVRATYAADTNRFATANALSNLTTGLRLGVTYRLK